MSFRRLGSRVKKSSSRQRVNKRQQSRHNLLQKLEDRRMLAGPELIAIRPDSGALLFDGDTLNVAPREFNLLFKGGADIDEASITSDSIKLVRSGGDGSFTEGNEVDVALGYLGLVNPGSTDASDLQQIVFRTASQATHNAQDPAYSFPDDTYQIQILGTGTGPLTNRTGEAFTDGTDFTRTFRLDLGSQVISVIPQPITQSPYTQALDEVVVYFDNQVLEPSQVEDPAYYRLVNTAESLDASDDLTTLPQTVTYNAAENSVLLKFANDIPEGTYRLDIGQSGGDDATLESALKIGTILDSTPFDGSGFLGDANGVSDDASDIDLYSMQINAGSMLFASTTSNSTVSSVRARLLDGSGAELADVTVAAGASILSGVPISMTGEYFLELSSGDGSTGMYGLNVSVTGSPLSTDDDNSSFNTATTIGNLAGSTVRITSDIRPQSIPLPPRAGSEDEPGHREIQRETHTGLTGTTPTLPAPVQVVNYYFPDTLGTNTSGSPYQNLITEKEKQIVREIFEIYAEISGYEFVESSATAPGGDQLMIGKGDMRSVDPTLSPGSVAGLASGAFSVLDGSVFDDSNRFFGDGFTETMFHEIGHSLGLGHSYDIPSNQGVGVPNDVLPGDHDVVHLQRIAPPNSTDIDMYEFTLEEPGRFRAETIAERRATPSLLDTALTLYREVDGEYELVAQNDQYFGADSFIDLHLEPGHYFVGVTSTGNTQYDPRIADSGYNGSTDGIYDLQLSFDAERDGALTDADGTAIDGDADGTPGGVYSFWFQASDLDTTIYVSKRSDTTNGPEGAGTLANPYDEIDWAFEKAGNRIVVPLDAASSISDGENFTIDDGINTTTFTFGLGGSDPIDITAATSPADVAAAIEASINNAIADGRLTGAVSATVVGRTIEFTGINNLDIGGSDTLLRTPNIVQVLADSGVDGNVDTLGDNRPYLVGFDTESNALADGGEFLVPQGVTAMVQAGALFKMRKANLDAGSFGTRSINRSHGAIQVLGTPTRSVFMRSLHNDTVGGDSDGVGPAAQSGDFGGIVFRNDSDLEDIGVFLNYVNHADINNGGGKVFVDANELLFTPIYIQDARPTVSFNYISSSNGAALSASPDSFDDSLDRIGPDIAGNYLDGNVIDALFVRVVTPLGGTIDKLDVSGRFDDTDIPHLLTENLIINGAAGGPTLDGGVLTARTAGRLMIDPGVVVKMDGARIEVERGAGTLIAEGTINRPVIFTSIADDRFGGSGSFNTEPAGFTSPTPGDWGGLYFGQATLGSIDNAYIAYAGGASPVEGGSATFNAIEIHQSDVRVANTTLQNNASGNASRNNTTGRGANAASVIYVRGAQPILINNEIYDNAGAAIFANANSLNFDNLVDRGRSTGAADAFTQISGNQGPLVRLNRLENNDINGLLVRGEVLTTESVWDDTDMVHVVSGEVIVENFHTYGGLKLLSSNSESLVIKFADANSGFTASGSGAEIDDRIGGTIQVLGLPGKPVVMTSLSDDSIGVGFTPSGEINFNTNNSAGITSGTAGDWRGLLFEEFSNDRNVSVVREAENPVTNGTDVNNRPLTAQDLGTLAPNEKSGDENRRLGFEVSGFISPSDADDVDVYQFEGTAGTEIWIDIDRTSTALDAIVEVVNASGTVLARSIRSGENLADELFDATLTKNPLLGGDHYTQNFRDPGFRYTLPGTPGTTGTYFVRVRSNPTSSSDIRSLAGDSRGQYQLQIRLRQVQEFPGSTVRYSDIRFANTAIDVRGLPAHSPIIAEAGETSGESFGGAQQLVNLLETDMAAIGLSGSISAPTDADWYQFELTQTGIQVIPGVNDGAGTIAVVFDIDYADGAVRADTTVAVYDEDQNLIFVGREGDIEDDQQSSLQSQDLSRGSLGDKDPYIGPIHLTPGTESSPKRFYVAVMSNDQQPSALNGIFQASPSNAGNQLVRLEPNNSVERIIEDHLGFQGYVSGSPAGAAQINPRQTDGLFDVSSQNAVEQYVKPFTLQDVGLYVATDQPEDNNNFGDDDYLYTVDAYQNSRWLTRVTAQGTTNDNLVNGVDDIQDVVVRSDGRMYGYQRLNGDGANVGALVEIDPTTGATTLVRADGIAGQNPTPNTSVYSNQVLNDFGRTRGADQFTTSDDVDALTFRRLRDTGGANPTPEYDLWYVVRESDAASKLYRATSDGDATLRRSTTPDPGGAIINNYGIIGDIQRSDVTYETHTLYFADPGNPTNRTEVRVRSKIAGEAGQFTLNINRTGGNTNADVTGVNFNTNTININIGINNGTGATAQTVVDELNNDVDSNQLVTAVIMRGNANNRGDGNGGTAGDIISETIDIVGSDGSSGGPLEGRVTGVAFADWYGTGSLFGVTDAGEFVEIDPSDATVVNVVDSADTIGVDGLSFEGLSLGPQNVEDGIYKNTLFAVTDQGEIVAFDTDGNGFFAFSTGDSAQIVRTDAGDTDGVFTLTTDAAGTGRHTTRPIAVDAPGRVSINEMQTIDVVGAGFGGTFTLSFVDDIQAISSPSQPITSGADSFIFVEDVSEFPASGEFVIQINDEQMRVTSVTTLGFNVVRGHNGTTATTHPDTATIFEVVDSPLLSAVSTPVTKTTTTDIDSTPGTGTFDIDSNLGLPSTPFLIRVDDEEMRVTNIVGTQLTVERGVNGTDVEAHSNGASLFVVDDVIQVVDPLPFPTTGGFNIRVGAEEMEVVSVSGNDFTVRRAINGTVEDSHNIFTTVNKVETTDPLDYNATTVEIDTALEDLASIGAGNVIVTGGPLTGLPTSASITVEFVNDLAAKNLQPLWGSSTDLIGDEIQSISTADGVYTGDFQLRFGGETTAATIPFDATPADIEAALLSLSSIGTGDVVVFGAGADLTEGPIFVQFTGNLADRNVALITVENDTMLNTEIQEILIQGNPDGGTFDIEFNGPAANNLTGAVVVDFDFTAAQILTAIEAQFPALAGSFDVTTNYKANGSLNRVRIEFIDQLAGVDVDDLTVTNNLTDSTALSVMGETIRDFRLVTNTISINEVRQGSTVDVSTLTEADGVISVLDALLELPDFNPGDITAAGVLPSPANGVSLIFGGAYTGVDVPLLQPNNSLNDPTSTANVFLQAAAGSGDANSFLIQSSGMLESGSAPIGIAFSPLDFNLWHPTTRRGTDAGHGVNAAPDDTRLYTDLDRVYDTGESQRVFDEGDGAVSWQFGFEQWQQNQNNNSEQYLQYLPGVNAQFGILTTEFHSDLSSNPAIVDNGKGTYNFPGGALGTLTTNSFDLVDTAATDRPTLYFNYFLETENHGGSNLDSDRNDPFRDSARVFISPDGGVTWELVATNSSQLSNPNPNNGPGTAELPGFLSHLSDAGLNSARPQSEDRQIVQELFDNTGTWRQARVDLSKYAGMTGLMMRVDFSTAGSMNDSSIVRIDGQVNPNNVADAAPYGEFAANANNRRSIRSTDNLFEGFYLDDIIIGYAERGEMITGTNADANLTDLQSTARTQDLDGMAFPDIVTGAYQLEIRRTGEFAVLAPETPVVAQLFDTNDRHILEGDETATVTFEPSTFVPPLNSVPGTQPWAVTSTNPSTGTQSLESPTMTFDTATFEATLADLGSSQTEAGVIEFSYNVSSTLDEYGLRFLIDGVPQSLSLITGETPVGDSTLASGETGYRTVQFAFGLGDHTFTWVYDGEGSGTAPIEGQHKAFIDNIRLIQGATGLLADRNRERPQGVLVLDANRITDAANVGINIQAGAAEAPGVPHAGSLINFPQLNADRYIPGVVVQNNVIAGSSAIRFAGEANNSANRTVSFGRILNNTLVGENQSGTGIEIVGQASPTVMNNLIADFGTGVIDGGIGSIIRSNYYQENAGNGATGISPIVGTNGDPLFVDAANRNFYLVNGNQAIDNAQITEQDRFDFLNFKTELGIPASPILAPDRDQFGQLRIEPDSSPVADRGAIENQDVDAPYATLLNPIDNDANDLDPSPTVVMVNDPLLDNFTILLGDGRGPNSPFEGTGINGLTVDDPNDATISAQAVRVEQDGQLLVQDVDYLLAYNQTSGVLRLTPLSTLWEPASIYTIRLDNSLISDRAGNKLRSNQVNGETRFTIIIPPVEIDFGDAPDSYGTLLASNGARHTISDSRTPRLGVEIDGEPNGVPSFDAMADDFSGDFDDEDGFNVGTFFGMAATDGLFLASSASNPTSNPADVVGFLNPNDPAGTVLSFDVVGDGVLDAWIDFNADGDFNDFGEKVIDGLAVTDGSNQTRIVTPNTAARGLTYARFRISDNGVSDPDGIGIGGEVEDYQVRVLDVDATDARDDDFYTVLEDHVLTVDGSNFSGLIDNDVLPNVEFIQPRVVVNGTLVAGTTDTYRTANGQVRIDDAAAGLFTYTPDTDFEGIDTFEYAVSTQRNEGPEFLATADFATVSIEVLHYNAPPVFDIPATLELNEDDPDSWTIDPFFMNVAGGDPMFGNDEGMENVTFSIVELTSDPAGLMTQLPVVTDNSAIQFFPAADQHGTVVYEITATDDGSPVESTTKLLTVSIRPINDPPRIDPNLVNTGEVNDADDAWSVDANGFITYTLREDNTPAIGQPQEEYFIPLSRDPSVVGYNPIGILDVFTVGPPNEADPTTVGGNQTLSLDSVPTQTSLGGTLRMGTNGDGIVGLFYTPLKDYNNQIGAFDEFTYTVIDDGQSWINGGLVDDPKTAINVVRFNLNPVNDRPEFEINLPPANPSDPFGPRETIETLEDAAPTLINNFVFNVAAGSTTSALDETNPVSGQSTTFSINPLSFAAGQGSEFFSLYPTISPEGIFEFQAAPNVFGSFDFEIVLTDDGPSDASRGDLTTSIARTITIDVLPINDPPVVRPDADPLEFRIDEDGSVEIMVNGTAGNPGLLDVFSPGPDNESENIVPGGNQTLSMRAPIPTSSTFEGTIEEIRENGILVGLRYMPKEDFVGTDTFTYTVTDDGVTVDFGTDGVAKADPRIATNTVKIVVDPLNDMPQYSGPANVVVDEDAGTVSISSWANNVLAGPPSALDELETQDVFFTITQVGGTQGMFANGPVAVIDPVTRSAMLDFETAPDANGSAIFEVQLTDVPDDGTPSMSTAVRTFTVTINAVNDIPTFDRVPGVITVNEDSAPYSETWATNISPGPADESSQTVRFEVATPTDAQGLFQQLPTVGDDGVLRFLPAANANGIVDLTVTAIDSAGASAAPVMLRIEITPENDIPVAVGDNIATDEDALLTIPEADLLANDIDPDINNPDDTLSIVWPGGPRLSLSGARVTFNSTTRELTYDPSTSFTLQALSGSEQVVDSFTYQVVDSAGETSNVVTVSLTVSGINDAPVALDDAPTLNPDGPTIIEILDNDSDIDGTLDPSTIEITLQPAFGSISIDDEGVVTFNAFSSFAQEDVFRYRIRDNDGVFSQEATVTIQANAAPTVRDDQAAAFLDEAVDINVVANDEDPDAAPGAPNNGLDLQSIQIVTEPLNGEAVPRGDGTIRYIPADGFLGIDTFQYTITDLEGRTSSPATVRVQVSGSRLQNPDLNADVNDDGNISPIDALLVINHLARSGQGSVPVTNQDVGPPYYDVNGDQLISPVDALAVINELARRQSSGGFGEGEATTEQLLDEAIEAPFAMDFIDQFVTDDDDEDDRLNALDAAFGDLL
ncbi:tandem-95 repeat protein [Roseiconus lacunae]|uniref:tandem-95 repeat protein n=1 Tax=Roseiconus lacunae TaxID=2605694 RepID=UPI0030856862|nr:tandem-95 repeat protein [Stieleria sp. HD01]